MSTSDEDDSDESEDSWKRIEVRVNADKKDRWDEHIEDTETAENSISSLVRKSVREYIGDDNGSGADIDLSEVRGIVSPIEDDTNSIKEEIKAIRSAIRSDPEILEVKINILNELPSATTDASRQFRKNMREEGWFRSGRFDVLVENLDYRPDQIRTAANALVIQREDVKRFNHDFSGTARDYYYEVSNEPPR